MGHPVFFDVVLVFGVCHVVGCFGVGDCVGCVGEGSFVFHFAGGLDEGSEGGAGEGASDADSLDSCGGELFDGICRALKAHQDVDGFGDCVTHFADGFETGESGGVEDVGAGLGEGLQTSDGVVEVGAVVKEVFGSCRQKELATDGRLRRRRNSFNG
jgi:hypothetical protein